MILKKPQLIAALLLATFAIVTSASAQQTSFSLIKKKNNSSPSYLKAQQYLKAKHAAVNNRPTETQQRVISQIYLDEDNLPSDSTTYAYLNNTRGSDFNYFNLDFGYNDDHQSGIMPIVIPSFFSEKSMSAYADTIKYYNAYNNNQFNFSIGYYRTDNQLDSIISGSGDNIILVTNDKTENSFNTSAKLQSTKRVDVGNPNDYSLTKYYYNSTSSKLLEDSTFYITGGVSTLDWITSYKYDVNDRIDSIITLANPTGTSVIMVDFAVLSYYPNGDLQALNAYELSQMSTNFDLLESDTFSYFNNFDAYESLISHSYDEGQLETSIIIQGTLGANGYPDSLKAQVTDYDFNEVFDVAVVYEYNSFNNPIKLKQYLDGELEGGMKFRYEEYGDSTTSIKPTVHNIFSIFPNPIKNQISIVNKGNNSGLFSIALIDIAGRTVFEHKQNIQSGRNLISIPNITKGIYILELKNEKGIQLTQKIVKE